jgi:hypothetical protein
VLRFVSNVLITLWLGFLAAAAVMSRAPASLEAVKGLDTPAKAASPDVRERIDQAVQNRSTPLTLKEAEVNHYIASILSPEETGVSRYLTGFDRVALSFDKDVCRVWLIWKTGGGARTAFMDFALRREKNQYIIEPLRGAYGRLPVFRGALAAIVPALKNLCAALEDEIKTIFDMNSIRFEKGQVVLDPRFEPAK